MGEMSGLKLPGLPDQLRGESEAGFVMGCGSASGYSATTYGSSAISHLRNEDGTVRTNLPETSDLTSPLARSEAARPRVKTTRGQNRRPKARCAIAALVS